MALRYRVSRFILMVAAASLLAACTTSESLIPDRRPDYRGARVTSTLELPPDLSAAPAEDTFAIPGLASDTATASLAVYGSVEQPQAGRGRGTQQVLIEPEGMRIRSVANQRWLEVESPPEVIWPRLQNFWIENGIGITRQDARIGIIETEWAENRADIPEGPIRAIIGRVMDFAYSAPTRDKFRMRLERVEDGTAVYITHYGMEEIIYGVDGEHTQWQSRPSDPALEAEMLRRLMVNLGSTDQRAVAQLAAADGPAAAVTVTRERAPDGAPRLVIEREYDVAWRLVGLALDGGRFVVEEQDRSRGLYQVEFRDHAAEGSAARSERGLFSRLAFWRGSDPADLEGTRHRVRLAGQPGRTVVVVQDADEQPESLQVATAILDEIERALR